MKLLEIAYLFMARDPRIVVPDVEPTAALLVDDTDLPRIFLLKLAALSGYDDFVADSHAPNSSIIFGAVDVA